MTEEEVRMWERRSAWLTIAVVLGCFWYVVGNVLWSLYR